MGGARCTRRAYHRFLWNRPWTDVHPAIGSRAGDVHRPRSLVVVDPSDVLCDNYWVSRRFHNLRGKEECAYRFVFHKSRLVLVTINGVAIVVELVTVGVCDRYRHHRRGRSLHSQLTGIGNRRNGLLVSTKQSEPRQVSPHRSCYKFLKTERRTLQHTSLAP